MVVVCSGFDEILPRFWSGDFSLPDTFSRIGLAPQFLYVTVDARSAFVVVHLACRDGVQRQQHLWL
jgi:hypothetical protein